jgi:transcriptional regulator with XRE-family HTH domain
VVTREALAALHPRQVVEEVTRVLAVLLAGMRRQVGWTQKELARVCRVSFQEIGQLERAEHDVGLVTLERICRALGTEGWRVHQLAAEWQGRECLIS